MQTQEERLVALEQRVEALQRDSITNHSDNTRLLTILNKVVAYSSSATSTVTPARYKEKDDTRSTHPH